MSEENEKYRLIIKKAGFKAPTPFQEKLIPAAMGNRYVIAETSEGCGKTLSMAVPVILQTDFSFPGIKTIIIASSPENVNKINTLFKKLFSKKVTSLQPAAASPDRNIKQDYRQLQKQPDIFIGTPDSIIDHIRSGNIALEGLQGCVIEDSDVDDYHGFEKDIEFILSKLSGKQYFMVFTKQKEHSYSFYQLFKKPVIIKSEKTEVQMKEKSSISSEYVKTILARIRENSDTEELTEIRKIIRKNVPFLMRGYFTAWLLKKTAETKGMTGFIKKEYAGEEGFRTIFINAGKNKGLFVRDVSRLIISSGLAGRADVKHIKVLDNYSFADVPSEKADEIIRNLNNASFKGKKLGASFARNTRSEKPSGE